MSLPTVQGVTMLNPLAASENKLSELPPVHDGAPPNSEDARRPTLYKPYAETPSLPELPYKPYSEEPGQHEPPYEPYKDI
jgi:hypothetical protein